MSPVLMAFLAAIRASVHARGDVLVVAAVVVDDDLPVRRGKDQL